MCMPKTQASWEHTPYFCANQRNPMSQCLVLKLSNKHTQKKKKGSLRETNEGNKSTVFFFFSHSTLMTVSGSTNTKLDTLTCLISLLRSNVCVCVICVFLSLFYTPGSLTPLTITVQNIKAPHNFSTFLQHGVTPGELDVKATWLGRPHKTAEQGNTTQDGRWWGFDELSSLVNKKWTAVQRKTGQVGWCSLY